MTNIDTDDEENLNYGHATLPLATLQNLQDKILYVRDRDHDLQIMNDPSTRSSGIRQSHLIRLGNINRRQADVFNLQGDVLYGIKEAFTSEDDYNDDTWFKYESIKRDEQFAVFDSVDGWKLKQLQLKPKEIRVEEGPPKKKGFFSNLF